MYENLPGGDILERGLESARKGTINEDSLLVMIGARRLGACGLRVPQLDLGGASPEDRLYELLTVQHGDEAYGIYNSMIRRLVSLENALETICTSRARGTG